MSTLTDDQVRHIAQLARLNLSEEEVSRFSTELTSILEYVDMLQEVDTKDTEALIQVTGQKNGLREDTIRTDGPESDALLKTSPLPIIDHQIQTPSAHG